MDDATDRGYSRAPELEDLVSICRSPKREKVAYLLIGGFAVILHGLVRTTKDIDLLIRMKSTSRDSDRSDVGFLRRQLEEERSRRQG